MSLIYCPECGHEVSQNAIACPNCGRPLNSAVAAEEPPVIVNERPVVAPVRREEGVPPWAFVLFGVLGITVVVILFLMFRGSGDDSNVNVAINANRRLAEANRDVRTTNIPPSDPQTVTVPGSQTSVPSTATTVPGTTTAAPPSIAAPPPDRGTVAIRAKIVNSRGTAQPARSTRFYLLDKDIETILNEAHVQPIEGNSLSSSIGLAAVYPNRYGDFQRAAMRAIGAHAKYSGTTDATGAAKLANIAPKEYYLFAITRVGNGFALWDAPVSIVPGENVMDLTPQSITEIPDTSG